MLLWSEIETAGMILDIDDTHRKTVISKLLNNEFEEYPVKNVINSLNNHPIISLL